MCWSLLTGPEEESLLEQIAADPSLVELFTDPVVVQVMTEMAADHIQKEADGQDGQGDTSLFYP